MGGNEYGFGKLFKKILKKDKKKKKSPPLYQVIEGNGIYTLGDGNIQPLRLKKRKNTMSLPLPIKIWVMGHTYVLTGIVDGSLDRIKKDKKDD